MAYYCEKVTESDNPLIAIYGSTIIQGGLYYVMINVDFGDIKDFCTTEIYFLDNTGTDYKKINFINKKTKVYTKLELLKPKTFFIPKIQKCTPIITISIIKQDTSEQYTNLITSSDDTKNCIVKITPDSHFSFEFGISNVTDICDEKFLLFLPDLSKTKTSGKMLVYNDTKKSAIDKLKALKRDDLSPEINLIISAIIELQSKASITT